MPEPIQPAPTPQGGATPPSPSPAPAPGDNTPPAGSPADLKALQADQLADVFENPHLYEHPRFKQLTSAAQELKTLKDKQAKDEEKRLEEQNEHKTLAEQRKAELEKRDEQIKNMTIDQALTTKLAAEGSVDIEAALKLADRSKLSVDDNGTVTGVEDVMNALKTGKPYLFKAGDNPSPSLGSPSNGNPGEPSGPAKFKRSQLSDRKFYNEHREEILKAAKAGLIEDDLS